MQEIDVRRHLDAASGRVFFAYTDHARWSERAGFTLSSLATRGSPRFFVARLFRESLDGLARHSFPDARR